MNLGQIAIRYMVIISILSYLPLLELKGGENIIQIFLMDSAGAKTYV